MNAMTQAEMKVEVYRDLINALAYTFASLRSAANDAERAREAERVKRAGRELMAARCPRLTEYDRRRAEVLLDQTAKYLAENGLVW